MKTKLLIVMAGFLSISCGGSGTPQKSISPTLALSQGIAALESQDVFTAESEFCDAAEFSPDDSSLAFGCFWSKMMLSPESDNASLALASLGEPAFDLETQIFGDTGIFALSSNIISTQFPLFNYTDFNLPFASYLKNKETEWPLEVVGLLQKAIDLGLGTSDIQERVANLTGTFVEFETYLTTVLNDPNFSFTLPGELFDIDHDIVVTPNDIKLMLGSVKLTIATLQIFSAYDLGVEIENFVHDGFYNLNQLVSDLNGDGTTVNGITLDTTAFLTLIDKETVANTESRIISGLEYILDGLNTVNEGESSDLSKPAVDERNLNPTLMMINDLLASYTNNTLTDVRFPGLSKTIKINLKAFFDNPPDAKTLDASSGYPFVVEDYKVKHVETYFIDLLNGTADF